MYQTINLDNQTIFHGDCLEVMKDIPDQSVDLVVTSPVYNIGFDYNTYKDNLSDTDYLQWMNDVFVQLHRLLKPDGALFLNVGSTCREPYRAMEVCFEARKHFELQNNIVWIKSIVVNDQTYGNFQPVISNRFLNHLHENVFHFTKTGKVKIDRLAIGCSYQTKYNIDRWQHSDKSGKPDKRCKGNVWHIPYETVKAKTKTDSLLHPAGFPEELVEHCLKLHGIKQDMVVFDPFLGAGTTLVACKKHNVKGMGSELDQLYVDIAQKRLNEF